MTYDDLIEIAEKVQAAPPPPKAIVANDPMLELLTI
jgi:hypothetical protein